MRIFLLIGCLLSGTAFAQVVSYSCTPLSYAEALEIDEYYTRGASIPGKLQYANATEVNAVPASMEVKVVLGEQASGTSFRVQEATLDIKTISGKSKQINFSTGYYYDSTLVTHLGSLSNLTYIEDEVLPSHMPSVRYTYVIDSDEDVVYLTVCSLTSEPIFSRF